MIFIVYFERKCVYLGCFFISFLLLVVIHPLSSFTCLSSSLVLSALDSINMMMVHAFLLEVMYFCFVLFRFVRFFCCCCVCAEFYCSVCHCLSYGLMHFANVAKRK